jgi:hypothetical protein
MDRLRTALALSCLLFVGGAATAHAQTAAADSPPPSASPSTAPDSTSVPSGGAEGEPPTVAGVPMVDARQQDTRAARYGIGLRGRWATVPKWLLGLFLAEKQSLSSYTVGLEGFRRSGSFDLVLGVAWQAMSPPDGNWLGKGQHNAATDTDYVQFRDFGAVSVDVAFISRTELNPYVFLHYGGGVGIGIVTGKILGTSNGSPGCATSPGDPTKCYPLISGCPSGPCSETALANSEGGLDTPGRGARHNEPNVPSVYPLVNLVVGLDFKIPNAGGLELKVDGGYFFPYFFLGAGTAYQF